MLCCLYSTVALSLLTCRPTSVPVARSHQKFITGSQTGLFHTRSFPAPVLSSAKLVVRNKMLLLFVNRVNHPCFISLFGGFCNVTLALSFCQFVCVYAYETSLRGANTHAHSQNHMLFVIPMVECSSPGCAPSHSARAVLKDVPKLGRVTF